MSMEYIDTELTPGQQIIALDGFIEPLEYEFENTPEKFIDWEEFILEAVENIVPIWNEDKVQWWSEMGTPEPEDYSPGFGDGIIEAITFSIYQSIEHFLLEVVRGVAVDDSLTVFEKPMGGKIVPNIFEVLSGAVEYRHQLGVSLGYISLAKAIIK